ncbi:MAG: glycosyltransferase [Planctomycetota bacterium]
MATVTIGLPTFNSEAFLETCLRSITRQSYSDFRVLVVDGGSTDSTLDRIKQWSARDERVRCWSEPVTGLYEAFNTILDETHSPYVCILPADDLLDDSYLQDMVSALQDHPGATAAVCPLRVFDERDEHIHSEFDRERWVFDPKLSSSLSGREAGPCVHPWPFDGMRGLLRENPFVSLTQLVLRRESLGGSRFRTDLGSTADILFNLVLGLNGDLVHVPTTWGGWRIHAAQASQRDSKREQKLQRMETMLSAALRSHLDEVDDEMYHRRLQELQRVMASWHRLSERVSGRPSPSRWVTVLASFLSAPRAASLYAMGRLTRSNRAQQWLECRAREITQYRVAAGLERNSIAMQAREH